MSKKRSEHITMIIVNGLILGAAWYMYSGHQAALKSFDEGLADYRKLQVTSKKEAVYYDEKISVISIGKTNPSKTYTAKYNFFVNGTNYEGSISANDEATLYTLASDSVYYLPEKPGIFALDPAYELKKQEEDAPWNWRLYLCYLLCGFSGLILLGYFGEQKRRRQY